MLTGLLVFAFVIVGCTISISKVLCVRRTGLPALAIIALALAGRLQELRLKLQ